MYKKIFVAAHIDSYGDVAFNEHSLELWSAHPGYLRSENHKHSKVFGKRVNL